MIPNMVVFYDPKLGNGDWEWEDGAAGWCGDPAGSRNPRFAVADGATEGFGSARWARCLVSGFLGTDTFGERLTDEGVLGWFRQAQARWHRDSDSAQASDLQRLKQSRVGSLATVVGCELSGLDGARPRWDAVALGDSVLFHVRERRLIHQFPALGSDDFGVNPDGVSTRPEGLDTAVTRLRWATGQLREGDLLYLATDALAHWMVNTNDQTLWDALAELAHPAAFRRLVTERRRSGAMTNDDVTLLRVQMDTSHPTDLVVCP